nr:Chain C, PucSBC1 [synthetic construct]3HQI_D Chain D, PucSBC1 [synthetic construct]3HU6_C Chain C, Puckered [synthetic construct]3HU6_D Chain D, Puckered [synthetic construct]
DEVTSTT